MIKFFRHIRKSLLMDKSIEASAKVENITSKRIIPLLGGVNPPLYPLLGGEGVGHTLKSCKLFRFEE